MRGFILFNLMGCVGLGLASNFALASDHVFVSAPNIIDEKSIYNILSDEAGKRLVEEANDPNLEPIVLKLIVKDLKDVYNKELTIEQVRLRTVELIKMGLPTDENFAAKVLNFLGI